MGLTITPRIQQSLKNRGLNIPSDIKWNSGSTLKTAAKLLKASRLKVLIAKCRLSDADDNTEEDEKKEEAKNQKILKQYIRIANQLKSIERLDSHPDVWVTREAIFGPGV